MRDQEPSVYNQISRQAMLRPVELATSLDYSHSHLQSAQATSQRAFVDWKFISESQGRQSYAVTNPDIQVAQAPSIQSLGEIIIVKDDGSLTLEDGELNYIAVWDRVRQEHGDRFDFLTFFTDFSVPMGHSFWSGIYLNTQGISPYSLPFNKRSDWNSTRLQGFHFINPAHINLMGVFLQEFGHQWSSYVYFADESNLESVNTNLLLGGEPGHWDHYMDDGHSPMDYDFQFTKHMSTHWLQRDDDPTLFDYHAIESIVYCDLDLYLMGLLPADEVEPFYFIANAQQVGPQTWSGQRVDVTIEQVINAMGPRQASTSDVANDFRNAWILVSRDDSTGQKMAMQLDATRQEFEVAYQTATRNLGRVDTRL